MLLDSVSGKLIGLDTEDIGSTVDNVQVECRFVICPRTPSGFTVFSCPGSFTVSGSSSVDPIRGSVYIVSGSVVEYKGRPQIKLTSISAVNDDNYRNSVLGEYIKDNFEGIGQVVALRIATEFGDGFIDTILTNPERISEKIKGISEFKVDEIRTLIEENESVYRELLKLRYIGLGHKQSLDVVSNKISSKDIEENPYRLMKLHSVSFNDCESIAETYKVEPLDKFRVYAATVHTVSELHELTKSTYFAVNTVKSAVWKLVKQHKGAASYEAMFESAFCEACEYAVSEGNIVVYRFEGAKCIACSIEDDDARISSGMYFKSEVSIKKQIESFVKASVVKPSDEENDRVINAVAKKLGITLDDSQRAAVRICMYSPISIITGGPGTGKTTIMGLLAEHFRDNGISCEFAAPTGRAAKRLSESVGCQANTLHRLLGTIGDPDSDSGIYFMHNRDNPIDARVIVVDEMSMVDTLLFKEFLNAVGKGTSLILVGDPNQLPSVGCGNVLSDLLSCKSIPSVKLEYIHRQDDEGSIAANAYRILNNQSLYGNNDDFVIRNVNNDDEAMLMVTELYKEAREELKDVIVLTPTKKTDVVLSTQNLNHELQQISGDEIDDVMSIRKNDDVSFREGDVVMQTKNNYSLEYYDSITGETLRGVFNGEIGVVVEADPIKNSIVVEFDDGKQVEYSKKNLNDVELAYAITVHKSQGCEFDEVIIALGKMNRLLYKKRLLYTAVTRGKNKVTIIDSEDTLKKFINTNSDEVRNTSLGNLLKIIDMKRGLV